MESTIVSSGFDLNRYVVDHENVANSAIEAIKELEALHKKYQQLSDDLHQLGDEEYGPHSSINSPNSLEGSFNYFMILKKMKTKAMFKLRTKKILVKMEQ
ncbi:hypothetical protein M8C21_033622 [Ambrosia artemisiifolia]|uniref:Uncharacterized protein n=1 Tax=Ambrosia artemisiifolia TaxID=4212 RepID=A0AAD5BKQ6_AMBAR|nr:hypothetical protein M8C21_033622 [Ambrosia artemisiifolia]